MYSCEMYKIQIYKECELKDPILIAGLPGVGNVAKLTTAYLAYLLEPTLLAEIFSYYLPSEVYIKKGGVVELPSIRFYAYKGEQDLIIVCSNSLEQPNVSTEQYELADKILTIAQKYGAKKCITIAGNIVERYTSTPSVWAAATSTKLLEELEKYGIKRTRGVKKSEKTYGMEHCIVGMNGILIGLCTLKGMDGFCLLPDTPRIHTNPRAAQIALETLQKILPIKIDLTELKEYADSVEGSLAKIERCAREIYEKLEEEIWEREKKIKKERNYFEDIYR